MAISTIGTGGDYASPKLWEASRPATLTEPEVVRILDDLSGLSNVQKTFDINVTTSATNNITIETGDATSTLTQDFKASGGAIPVIQFGRSGTFGFVTRRAGCDHLVLRNVTVEITNSASNIILDIRSGIPTDNYTDINNNYFYAQDDLTNNGGLQLDPTTKGVVHNNIFNTGSSIGINANNAVMDIYNNTLVGTFSDIELNRTGIRYNQTGTTERNAVFHYGSTGGNKDYLNNAATFNDNASSDTSGNIGFQSLVLLDQYTDPQNHDWSFKAGNSLEGAATAGANIGAFVEASAGISITEQIKNINLTSLNPSITLTGSIVVTEQLKNINFSSVNPTVTLTGSISIIEKVNNIQLSANNPIIDLTGVVSVVEQLKSYTVSTNNPTVTLTSTAIQVIEQTNNINLVAKNPSILLTPEPIGIESVVCFNGTLKGLSFNGVNYNISYNGTEKTTEYNGNLTDTEFNGTINTNCNNGNIKTDC